LHLRTVRYPDPPKPPANNKVRRKIILTGANSKADMSVADSRQLGSRSRSLALRAFGSFGCRAVHRAQALMVIGECAELSRELFGARHVLLWVEDTVWEERL